MSYLSEQEFDVSKEFSGKVALALGRVSKCMYLKDKDTIREALEDGGFKFSPIVSDGLESDCYDFYAEPKTGTEYMVAADNSKVIVAFRGSDEAVDWLENIDYDLVDSEAGGKVHEGVQKKFLSIRHLVLKTLRNFNTEKKPVFFTGHSLGGGLAILCALHYQMAYSHSATGVYTYGALKVGDKDFAAIYNKHLKQCTYRYINNRDIVPMLPPEFNGYRHVGCHCLFLGSDLTATYPKTPEEDFDALMKYLEDNSYIPKPALFDHKIAEYINRLNKHIHTKPDFQK